MKQAEVKIGGVYLTYIGQTLAPVVVVARCCPGRYGYGKHTRFLIHRENEVSPLPKHRTGAALREMPIHTNRAPEPYPDIQDRSPFARVARNEIKREDSQDIKDFFASR